MRSLRNVSSSSTALGGRSNRFALELLRRFTSSSSSSSGNSIVGSSTSSSSSQESRVVTAKHESSDSSVGGAAAGEYDSYQWITKEFASARAEVLPSGIKVYNLPPAPRNEGDGAFDMYRKSTSDYVSTVTGVGGLGLGAGFGNRPDKRLGWLRPRKNQHELAPVDAAAATAAEYQNKLDKIETHGPQDLPAPRNDKEHRDQIDRMRRYMNSMEGSPMSTQEHFLLTDLDFEQDSLLFGSTREEFVKNVEKLREVISGYTKWERTDNLYMYGTWILKFAAVWLLVDILQTYYRFELLGTCLEPFAEIMAADMESLQQQLEEDLEKVKKELRQRPPDFAPVVQAIRNERARLRRVATDRGSTTTREDDPRHIVGGLGDNDADLLREARHPMDTSFERATTLMQERQQRRKEMETLLSSVSVDGTTPSATGQAIHSLSSSSGSDRPWWRRAIGGVFGGDRRASPSHSSTAAERSDITAVVPEPLDAADITALSYAAAPTSIATVRAIRRHLLPRADDFTQIVREEMVAHRQQKDAKTSY